MDYKKLHEESVQKAIQLIAEGKITREVAGKILGVEFDEDEITKQSLVKFLKKENKGRWVQWIEANCATRKVGVEIIDDDSIRLTDEYCSFVLHRPAEIQMNWDDAMEWAKERGWSLPDRHQGLTIAKYKKEVIKHFGGDIDCFWTREKVASNPYFSWIVFMTNGPVTYSTRYNTDYVVAFSAF